MSPLRILIVHNHYRQAGGEDTVVATEAAVLRSFGHEVKEYRESNDESFGPADFGHLYWSSAARQRIGKVIAEFRPDIAHCHNVFYRITPSVYWSFHRLRIPIVQTLHNFRLGCSNARLSRNGKPCELCLEGRISFWPGVYHSCFQESALRSFVLASSIKGHELLGSFSRVNTFIALSRFALERHMKYGIPADRTVVKPNCVFPDPGFSCADREPFCLFAGRLELDKGVLTLLEAARLLAPHIEIRIAGTGPLEHRVREAAATLPNVRLLGQLPRKEILNLMGRARCFVFPSLAYENFPMTLAEAFSIGAPVIASGIGAAAEIIIHGRNGLNFEPGSPVSLAAAISELWRDDGRRENLARAGRADYETRYSAQATYDVLLNIYRGLTASPRSLEKQRREAPSLP